MKQFILLILMLHGLGHAQNCIRELDGGGCIVEEKGKYGVMRKGKHIVPAYFDQLNDHTGKFFSVQQNEKWGVFTDKGKLLLPVSYTKVKMVDAYNGILTAEGNGYNNVVISDKIVIPPGAFKASPFLAVSNLEVAFDEYMAFMEEMKTNPPADFTYAMAIPDSAGLAENVRLVYNAFFIDTKCAEKVKVFNFSNAPKLTVPCQVLKDKRLKDYLKLPMTGISFKQAQRYCIWLSDKFNDYSTKDLPYEMIVRLPRPIEWEEIAHAGMSETMSQNNCIDSVNTKKCVLMNYKFDRNVCSGIEEQISRYGNNVVPVTSYNPDYLGSYNMFGNVAEMTNEQSISKGGSYIHYASQCKTIRSHEYHKPQPWLGFRWVVEYRLKKVKLD